MRIHGMKHIRHTTGDITDVQKHKYEAARLTKIYCDKSAEAIGVEYVYFNRKVHQ